MRFLLDTHVFLWALREPARLSRRAQKILMGTDPLLLSYVSIWEVAIKAAIGKVDLPRPVVPLLCRQAEANRVSLLPICLAHIRALEALTQTHGDPFDRLLIAQAQSERLAIVTVDRQMAGYGVPVIW
ncbi:MAG: type II toxin-antitoxin system VapC family toxin [Terriglobales bacterium]